MEYLITTITIFIEDLALLNLSNAFLKRTCSNKKLLYSFILFVSLQVIMVQFFIKDVTIFKTLFILICNYIYIKYIYDGKIGNTIFTIVLCYIFNVVCDYLAIIGMTLSVNVSLEQIYQSVSSYVILTFIAKFLFFVGTFLFEKIWSQKNKKSDISALEWGQMLIFPIISVIILIMMIYTNIRDGNDSFWSILITLGLFAANIITLFIISRLSEDKKIKQEVRGRNLITGLPDSVELTQQETEEALRESVGKIIKAATDVLEQTPPELAGDIYEKGVVLTGGGALLNGLVELLEQNLKIPVFIAESPLTCVVEGTGMLLDNIKLLDEVNY